MTTRQPNAWSVCGASAAAVSAVAAIAAAAIAGGVVDYRAPATPGETVISEITATLESSVTDLKNSIQTESADLAGKVNPTGSKPFLQRAYASVQGKIDAHYQDWATRVKPIRYIDASMYAYTSKDGHYVTADLGNTAATEENRRVVASIPISIARRRRFVLWLKQTGQEQPSRAAHARETERSV